MENITTGCLLRATTWLIITTLFYFLMNGAQIFETAVIVPKWTASPPESFQLFKGKHGLDFKMFWIVLHSIHEVTFILAIVFCWKLEPIRNWLLFLFIVHFAVHVWTILYFAPNIMAFQSMADSPNIDAGVTNSVKWWALLNYVRVGIFMLVSFGLLPLCIKIIQMKSE
jgi:hypothetical protein